MSNRSWFFASAGKQQGPYSEDQFRDLIAQGVVRAETLVWTEGMPGWQKAAEIPGMFSGGGGRRPMPIGAGPAGISGSGRLSMDFGILEFTWRSIVLLLGLVFVIPAPWALVWYMQWIVPCVQVPGRPNISFTGRAMTIVPWYFGAVVLMIAVNLTGLQWLSQLMSLVQIALGWLFLKWTIANIASNGQPVGLSFSGSIWIFLGWNVLAVIALITIVGWAWVYVAQLRWICQNIQGTRREVTFTGTGLELLWRSIVAILASVFIIPIPWVYRWMWQWLASQTVLADRSRQAHV
ncbi:MAG: DUF4339 domain-containing protein [Bradyrhizobium sp.]|uniref:DUF4339 domain-containing protein n=1 Tax=Bradyrhizobium sp. TaxID=376 RepID=UPI0025BBB68E|nr:DUF4339 domain-containing protein [Bradyrhizobium sp.]MBI5262641.1 DUF4339 domain-containing protein [Bradyrhizobium sp.]